MTDDARDADWAHAVAALPAGAAVIVRHRDRLARAALARRLKPICAARRIKLLIADDEALAILVRADGFHAPQRARAKVRAIKARHPRWLVTAAAHDAASVRSARAADAVIVAAVFATASHPGRAALGPVRFAALAREACAAYALGGIDASSVQRLAAMPVCGIALIGGWVS